MTDTTEHRGWEIDSSYQAHWADDADWDLAEDSSDDTPWGIWVTALLGVALLIGVYLYGKWLEPPISYFPAPQITIHNPLYPLVQGYSYNCIAVDGAAKTVSPYYADPYCQQRFLDAIKSKEKP